MRVACDTNVLVSALIAGGPPGRVLEQAIEGELELIVPEAVLAELVRVLSAKLGFSRDRAQEARRLVEELAAQTPATPQSVKAVSGDPGDDAILAAADAAGAEFLVTGDRRHLLPLGSHEGMRILTPRALLAELARKGS